MTAAVERADLAAMRRAAGIVQSQRNLRTSGRWCVLFGVLALGTGLSGLSVNLLNAILLGIGVFLIVVGIRVMRSPTPRVKKLEAIAIFVVAGWNLFVGLAELAFGGVGIAAVLLGGAQVYWGVKSLRQRRQYAALVADGPPATALAQMEAMVRDLTKRHVEDQPGVIEFKTRGVSTYHQWRVRLGERWALFVDKAGSEVMVVTPGEVDVIDRGEALVGHQHKVTVRVPVYEMKGKMTEPALQALSAWKASRAV